MGYPELEIKSYNFFSEFSDKSFKVQGVAVVGFVDLLNGSVDEFVFLLKTKSGGSHEDISHLNSSLSGIWIEGEHWVKFFNEFLIKNGILVPNRFGHDGVEILFVNFSSWQHFTESFLFVLIKILYSSNSSEMDITIQICIEVGKRFH